MCAFAAGMNAARASRQVGDHEEDVFQRETFVRHPRGPRAEGSTENVGITWRGGGLMSGSVLQKAPRRLETRQRSLLDATLPGNGSAKEEEEGGPMPLFGGGQHPSGSRFLGSPAPGVGLENRPRRRGSDAGPVGTKAPNHTRPPGHTSVTGHRVDAQLRRQLPQPTAAPGNAFMHSGQFSMVDGEATPQPVPDLPVHDGLRRGLPAGRRDGVSANVGIKAASHGFDRDALADIVEAARAEAALAGAERLRDAESKSWQGSGRVADGGNSNGSRSRFRFCCCHRRARTAPEPGSLSGSRFRGSFRGSKRRVLDQLDAFVRHADPLAIENRTGSHAAMSVDTKRLEFARQKRPSASPDGGLSQDSRGKPGCMLHPEADHLLYWNLAMIVLISFYTFTVPIRLAFDTSVPDNAFANATHGWLVVDCIADTLFLIDLAMNFRTGLKADGVVIWNWKRIAIIYLRTWFLIDAVASIPTSYISLFNADNSSTASLQVGNMLRILRIFKLFRAFRLKRIFKRLQSDGKINASFLRFVRIIFFLFLLWHMLACAYWAIASYQGFCAWEDPLVSANGTSTEDVAAYQTYGVSGHLQPNGFQYCASDWVPWMRLLDQGLLTQYLQAFLWGVTIVTGVGRDIIPQANVETLMSIVSIVVGVIVYALIVGSLSSVISNLDSASAMRQRKLDDINLFMRHQKVPDDLQTAITDYYEFMWKRHQKLAGGGTLLTELPMALRMRLKIALTHHDIRRIPLFNGASPDTMVAITQCLSSVIAVPNEFILLQGEVGAEVLTVKSGKLHEVVRPDLDPAAEDRWRDGPRRIVDERSWRDLFVQRQNKHKERFVRELVLGDVFGDNSIINIPHDTSVLALTFCDLYVMEADDLKLIIQGNRTLTARLERIAVRRRIELANVLGSHAVPAKTHAGVRHAVKDALHESRLQWVRQQFAPVVEGAADEGLAENRLSPRNRRGSSDLGSDEEDTGSELRAGPVDEDGSRIEQLAPGVFVNHGQSGGRKSRVDRPTGPPARDWSLSEGSEVDEDEGLVGEEKLEQPASAPLAPLAATIKGVERGCLDEGVDDNADEKESSASSASELPRRPHNLPPLRTPPLRTGREKSHDLGDQENVPVSPAGSTSTVDSLASLLGPNAKTRMHAMIEDGTLDDTALLIAERDAALGERLAMELEVEDLLRRREADAMAAAELDRQRESAESETRRLRKKLTEARRELARLRDGKSGSNGGPSGSIDSRRQPRPAQGSFFGRFLGASFMGGSRSGSPRDHRLDNVPEENDDEADYSASGP